MPFDGNGIYNPIGAPDFPAVSGTLIRASQYNNEILDIADALTNCITKDGQSLPTNHIPWNNKRITGLASPVNLGDAANKGYVDNLVSAQDLLYADRSDNLIINPHGSIFQEGGAAIVVPAGGGYFVDQWFASRASSTGALQAGGTPSTLSDYDTQAFFIKTTTAQASLAATDYAVITQPVEGAYHRRLLYGTASAKGSWLRFRAVCTQSATCSLAIRNLATNRSWVQTFSVSTTPTDYAFFIPGDTTGTWPTGNTAAAYVTFCFAAGTTYQTATLGSWQAGAFFAGAAQTNLMGTLNAQLTITDVSWRRSQVLLPFEPTGYTVELLRCQRYFVRHTAATFVGMGFCYATNGAYIDIRTPVAMRVAPAISPSGAVQLLAGGGAVAVSSIGNVYWNPYYGVAAQVVLGSASLTVGQGTAFYTNSGVVDINARM